MIKVFYKLFILLIYSSLLFSQEAKNYLLSSAEILKIMEESKLVYQPKFIETTEKFNFPQYVTISDQFYTCIEDESIYLRTYSLSENGKSSFIRAEEYYKNEDYDTAIKYYRDILLSDSNYYKTYTFIGDMYFMKENYDSAKYYFNYAIQNNIIDYTAHWFLADTYRKLDDIESSVKEITIAHLLNRNHQNIIKGLKKNRAILGKDWIEWELNPISNTYKEDDKIIIETTQDWMGYAFAEAVWKYESEFVEKILGKPFNDSTFLYEKEAAGIVANLNLESMKRVNEIVEDGYFQEMVWYEILSRKYPSAVLLLPQEFFNKIIAYINKYH